MPQLLIATKNAHKAQEIRAILGGEWDVTDLNAHPEVPAPEETGTTFAENAAIKAVAASRLFTGFVLSDDSGLEVDALGDEKLRRKKNWHAKKMAAENSPKIIAIERQQDLCGSEGRQQHWTIFGRRKDDDSVETHHVISQTESRAYPRPFRCRGSREFGQIAHDFSHHPRTGEERPTPRGRLIHNGPG